LTQGVNQEVFGMKWSWKIGRFAGIDVYMHVTFLLLVGFIAFSAYWQAGTWTAALEGVVFILALFASVVLHEFGHALTARRYHIPTRDITLYPIGGVARLERMPDKPIEELWVALAGPAVNVVIAGLLFAWLSLTGGLTPISRLGVTEGPLLERLLYANVSLVLFNLLPAFPMDGGRVLRALLALRLDYERATQIAAWLGQGMAVLFGFAGLFGNPFLLFIAWFVWSAASQETSLVQIKSALGSIPISRAMLRDFRAVSPTDTLQQVTDLILAGSQQDFPVVADGAVVGILTRRALMNALAQRGGESRVAEVMERDFHTASPNDMLEPLFLAMQSQERCRIVPVVRQGQLVGLVTPENIGEFLMIQSALDARPRAGSQPVQERPPA
jgi:Zn-dependent protease/CBS domain-containing protein